MSNTIKFAASIVVVAGVSFTAVSGAYAQAEAEPLDPALPSVKQEHVVTATRTRRDPDKVAVATEVITKEELKTSGARTLSDVLRQEPGITIDRNFRGAGAGVRMQGLDPKHVLVLVDGQRVVGRFGGTVDIDRFLVEDVDRVEIVKGSGSALYGSDAMGGVINIITRPAGAQGVTGEIGASYGTLNETNAYGQVGVNHKRWDARTSAGFHKRDAFDLDPSDVKTSGGEDMAINASNRTAYRVSDSIDVVANLRYQHRQRDDIDTRGALVFDRGNTSNEGSVAIGPRFRFDDGSQLELTGYYSVFQNTLLLTSDTVAETVEDTFEQFAQATTTYTRTIADDHQVTVVGEGIYERLESDRLSTTYGERMRGAVALQDEWSFAENLQVVAGARVDVDTEFGAHPTPKVAVRYDPVPALVLRAGYGMGFRAPDFKELFLEFNTPNSSAVIRGNSDLDPESSHSFNAGAELRLGHTMLSVNGFRNNISNLIFVKPVATGVPGPPTDFQYQNVSEAYTQGVEAAVSAEVIPRLRMGLGYVLTDAQDLAEDRALEGRPLHRGTVDLSFLPRMGFEGTVSVALVGERPYYERQRGGPDLVVTADPYAMVDMRVAQRIAWGLKLFGGVRNLMDAGDVDNFPAAPRTLYLGLSATLDGVDSPAQVTASR